MASANTRQLRGSCAFVIVMTFAVKPALPYDVPTRQFALRQTFDPFDQRPRLGPRRAVIEEHVVVETVGLISGTLHKSSQGTAVRFAGTHVGEASDEEWMPDP